MNLDTASSLVAIGWPKNDANSFLHEPVLIQLNAQLFGMKEECFSPM